jgi:hypothetical protein
VNQQKTIDGAVLFPGEILTEIVDIQAADAFVFAQVKSLATTAVLQSAPT